MNYRDGFFMATRKYNAVKVEVAKSSATLDALTVEQPLTITINGKPFTITMHTPGNEKQLVRGLLFSEDIYRGSTPLSIEFEQKKKAQYITHAHVSIDSPKLGDGYKNSRNLLSVSSCGICGKTDLDELDASKSITTNVLKVGINNLHSMYADMEKAQAQFSESGGSHAAAIFDSSYRLLTIKEDIGRHNAVDKAIGELLDTCQLKKAEFILVSGRISYEILSKTFAASIPIIAAVSAPSSLAVDYAKELGITLIGFARKGKFTVYSHLDRIV